MHGLGNDFVVFDARMRPLAVNAGVARRIADRRTGVGCDQLILIEPSENADVRMRILNADGGEVEACGNGARCIAALLMAENGAESAVIETAAGLLDCHAAGPDQVTVDMGEARLGWRDIPLAREADTLELPVGEGPLQGPTAVGMGNPHAVFFVDDAEAVDLAALGPVLERHPLFPERANIGVAQVLSPQRIRLRVWERGAGLTQACGSGACAAVAAAHRRGLGGRDAEVILDGGRLKIAWREDGHMVMTGPVTTSFQGHLPHRFLA
ncbi:MAG: diaminopimelate epimerase [Alphaproteobacteria bacterium]